MQSKKKICLIIPSLSVGGMERVMSELANHFAAIDYCEVHLLLYGLNRDIFYSISDKIIIHKPSFEFDNSKRKRNTIKTMFFLRKKLKEINPDSALSFGEKWNNFVLLSALGTSIPIFISDRSQPNKSLGKFQDALRRWLYSKAKGIIAQTEKARQVCKEMYSHSNICVIGNPIRTILTKTYTDEGRENTVLMVGRLISTKHQDRLIKMFLEIGNKDWKLVLVGYDSSKQNHSKRLQGIIDQNKANDRVILSGEQANVDSYYLSSKVFAFTSSSEGFPNVIGEAFSAGLPVVSYDCEAGPSEMITHGLNGFLVPVFDDDSFKYYLKRLMDDDSLRKRLSVNALESINKFDRSHIAEAFFNFISS